MKNESEPGPAEACAQTHRTPDCEQRPEPSPPVSQYPLSRVPSPTVQSCERTICSRPPRQASASFASGRFATRATSSMTSTAIYSRSQKPWPAGVTASPSAPPISASRGSLIDCLRATATEPWNANPLSPNPPRLLPPGREHELEATLVQLCVQSCAAPRRCASATEVGELDDRVAAAHFVPESS